MLYEALSLKERSLGGIAWHDAIIAGFPGRSLNSLARHLGLKPGVLAQSIGIAAQDFKANEALSPCLSDAVYRLALGLQRASAAFRDEQRAALWLNTPQPVMANLVPLRALLTDEGAALVWTALEKIPKKVAKERENQLAIE